MHFVPKPSVNRKLNNAIQWINRYAVENAIRLIITYPPDSDYLLDSVIRPLYNWAKVITQYCIVNHVLRKKNYVIMQISTRAFREHCIVFQSVDEVKRNVGLHLLNKRGDLYFSFHV